MVEQRVRPASPARSAWRRVWTLEDDALRDAGATGELLVARVRLVLCAVLLVIPLHSVLANPSAGENYVGLGVLGLTFLLGLGAHVLARRDRQRRWFGFATGMLDVSLVSFALVLFLMRGEPHTAVNSKVVFEVYFLALAATCLRYDARVCVIAGALAVAQYAGIVTYAAGHWDLNSAAHAPFAYGMFSWSAQISRLILLAAAALLSTTVVVRAGQQRRLATRDRMTQLFNRGHFDERLTEELRGARRNGRPFSVALLDLDLFKQFNDVHGHIAGDAALRAFAAVLRRAAPGDVLARYGGEEFVVLLPNTSAIDAAVRMETVRRAVAVTDIALPGGRGTANVTVSIGVASWPVDGDDAEALLHCADTRLFAAKGRGRDCVVGAADEGASADARGAERRPAG